MSFHPETENYKYWTSQEERQLESLVKTSKYSFKEIGKLMNRSGQSCQDHSRIIGLNNNYIKKTYSCNEDFWSSYNSINMYWAGILAADGYIYEKTNTVKLEIQKKDQCLLEKLQKDTSFTGKIFESIRPEKNSHTVRISITSPKWVKDLNKNFGLFQGKTKYIMPPKFDNQDLLLKWLQGYTDGDGSIYLNGKKDIYISYISCNKNLIEWIQQYFMNFGVNLINKLSKVKELNGGRYYKYCIGGTKAAQFIKYINALDGFKLKRKWENPEVLEVIKQYESKWPEIFKNFEQKYINSVI